MKQIVIFLFRTLWEFPQLLVGLICLLIYKARYHSAYKGSFVFFSEKIRSSVCFGYIIIIVNEKSIPHEYGHSRQSMYLGPLYLLVIGVCSVAHKLFHHCSNYYHFFTEKWADKISGIKTKNYD